MDQRLLRPAFDRLRAEEKRSLMEAVAARTGFALKRLETFSHWGWGVTTGVFGRDGAEFVFVPGAAATIGWERFAEGMDEGTRADIREDLEAFGYAGSVEDYLREVMLPPREVTLGPMLAERGMREIGWEQVTADDPRFTACPDWVEEYQRFTRSGLASLNLVGCARFDRVGEDCQIFLYHDVTHAQLLEQLRSGGYTLPTAAEWACLCGGGCRTVSPWGDSLDGAIDSPQAMERPNGFGLSIACDPYKQEVTEDGFLCGGDGGCSLCGGAGPALGFLPCSPHCRPEEIENGVLDIDYHFCRRILRLTE